ncbi:MAG: hypothetical protein UMR38_08210 [Candidatus Izemoplasma sp.]|nr:hypothetical protein [Candidatus Izemoplasma sp.]
MVESITKLYRRIKVRLKSLNKQDIKKHLLLFSVVVIVVHGFYVTLIYVDRDYQFNILNKTYVSAVAPGQSINDVLYTDVIVIRDLTIDTLNSGDKIVSYGDYGVEEYWVMQVDSINEEINTITYTYDGTVAYTATDDDIIGAYARSANLIGTVYYAATYIRGYVLLVLIHLFFIAMVYFSTYEHKEDNKVS